MPSRLDRVIDVTVPQGETTGTQNIPRDVLRLQVVIDRLQFEDVTDIDTSLVRVDLWDAQSDQYIGHCEWRGGRVEDDTQTRPGARQIWSTANWTIPSGTRRIRYTVTAYQSFDLVMHVDLFFAEDFQ